jgi:caffeoyl-CoA O-methyltransferase
MGLVQSVQIPAFSIYLYKNHLLDLINPKTQEYAEEYSSPEDDLLKHIAHYTRNNMQDPGMLSGHLQGKVLEMISIMVRPRRILEIGTFTGYSAIALAKGLTNDGQLHTIELSAPQAEKAREFFNQSAQREKIILHTGNALSILPELNEEWDLVFIDADKPGYIEYFDLVLPKLRKNGFILADNIFFHGDVLDKEPKGKNPRAMQAFNKYIKERTDVDKVILTIRDGLYLIRKL